MANRRERQATSKWLALCVPRHLLCTQRGPLIGPGNTLVVQRIRYGPDCNNFQNVFLMTRPPRRILPNARRRVDLILLVSVQATELELRSSTNRDDMSFHQNSLGEFWSGSCLYWPLAKDRATTGQKEPGNRVNRKAGQPVLTR